MDIATIVGYALLAFVGVLALIGALKGLSRGICRQTVRSVTIIASVVISIVLVRLLYGFVMGYFDGKTVSDIINQLNSYGLNLDVNELEFLNNFDTATLKYIVAIPLSVIVGPILFVPVFMIISAILLIVHAIVSGIVGFSKDKNNAITRLLGMALGLVQGAFVAVVLLVPVLGLANIVSTSVETMRENETKSEAEVQIITVYDENVKSVIENPTVKLMSGLGGNLMYELVSTVKVTDTDVKMTEQLGTVVSVYADYTSLGTVDFKNLTPEQQTTVRGIIDKINNSEYFSPLLANITSGLAKMLSTNESIVNMEEPLKSLMIDILAVFESSDGVTIKEDLNTFCDLYFLLCNEGVLSVAMPGEGQEGDDDAVMDALMKEDANGKSTVDRAVVILDSNPRTKAMVSSLVKISIAYATDALKDAAAESGGAITTEQIEEVYNNVKAGINEVVKIDRNDYATHDEYKGAVSDSLENFVVDNGFVEESFIEEHREEVDEVLSVVSDHVIENFAGLEEVSDAQLIGVLFEYYTAYANGNFGGTDAPEIDPEPQQ